MMMALLASFCLATASALLGVILHSIQRELELSLELNLLRNYVEMKWKSYFSQRNDKKISVDLLHLVFN